MRPSTRRRFVIACGVATAGRAGAGSPAAARDRTDVADGRTWESGPAMPGGRTEAKAAVLEGRLYVFGGFVPEDDAADPDDPVTDAVAVYDPGDEEWTRAEPMPERLHHVSVAATDDRIYVIGGHEGDFEPVGSVHVFDGETWAAGEPMPTPRGALTAGLVDGRIYAAGGEDGDGPVATLEAYDPEADEWSDREPMPTPREHLTSGVVDGRFYATGGRVAFGDGLAVTEAYDPEADEWKTVAEAPTARGGHGAAAVDGRLCVVGGESPERTFDETEAYDPETDGWEELEPMPTPRHGLGVAAIDGDVYAAAGGPDPGFSYSGALEVLRRG